MWDSARPPMPVFREDSDESFPPRWPHGLPPRMRGRPPFPFRGGTRGPSPHIGGQGGLPFNHRGTEQNDAWEEGRIPSEEQINFNLSRRGRPPMNYRAVGFREGEMQHYREQNALGNEIRLRFAPDMDYRERDASGVDHRERGIPAEDYRHDEEPAIAYRGRLPPPSIYRERESLEYRKRMAAEMELRDRETLELEHRERLATALEYREREVEELEYKRRLNILLERREREAALLERREREAAMLERREQEAAMLERREQEAALVERREREAALLERREREAALLERREREAAMLERREQEAAMLERREQEAAMLERREQEAAMLERREREAAMLERREREAAMLERREREAAMLERREREAAMLERRERGDAEQLLREREATQLLLRERGSAEMLLREREAVALALRERGVMELELRERAAMNYRERGIRGHFRESADSDLRVRESEALRFRESDMDVDFIERERGLDYREMMDRDYSGSENMPLQFRDKKTAELDYMEAEYTKQENFKIDERQQKSTEMVYRQGEISQAQYKEREITGFNFQKNTDIDYREKESAYSDYHQKKSADSDYRDRENTDLDYRDTKTVDTDYREIESADSYYQKRESADTDYRKSVDNSESTDTMVAKSDDSNSLQKMNQKALTEMKSLADYSKLTNPELASKDLLSVFDDFRESLPKADNGSIPFLSCEDSQVPTLSNIKHGAQTTVTPKGDVQSESDTSNCPGKLDMDFRDRPNLEDLNHGDKSTSEKVVGYKKSPSKELCPSDQDLRKKEDFSKDSNMGDCDQDFRTVVYMQEKDEDLRSAEDQPPVDLLTQNSLLYDFLQMAARELKHQIEKGAVTAETEGPSVSHRAEKPATDPVSHLDQNPVSVKSSGPASNPPGIEFLGGEDTDYRNIDFNDVDLRVGNNQAKRSTDKKSREDPQPGSKDKDYRRVSLPDGATRTIWLDGLPTGGSREEILAALGGARKLPNTGVNLIGYIPGYSLGSVCVEFSLVEEAVGCMEANKGALSFKGKKINLKYVPNSDRWNCQQCKTVNVLSKERCWQCSALRAGSDHLPLRDSHKTPTTAYSFPSQRGKKRKAKRSPSARSPDKRRERTPPRERSPPSRTNKGAKEAKSESSTCIIRGLGLNPSPQSVINALEPYVTLSTSSVRLVKNRRKDHRGFGFIDLKNHKEAIRLTVLVRELKTPLTVDGKPITVELAVRQRKNEQSKSQKSFKMSTGKNRKQRGQRRTYQGYRGNVDNDGPSYVFDPKTGLYVDPLTDMFYDDTKTQRKKDEHPPRAPEREGKVTVTQTRRGFTEDEVNETSEDPFKKPLPPQMTKKEEPPPEPITNPLIKLIGEYGDDSDDEEEQEELLLPPLRKKPPPPPPPAPKPIPKPAAPTSSNADDNLTDWKKMACLLCRRQFSSKDALIRHQMLSLLHKQNLAIHEKSRKSQKQLVTLQQKERKETMGGLDTVVLGPETKEQKDSDTSSENQTSTRIPAGPKRTGASYRENMKRLILARYKDVGISPLHKSFNIHPMYIH
ncbi:uncharacterized protein LOC142099920 isoform X2 [Mixophyes fleayi]|uniref:uncharacterized protein LOC142099920 isoform X2 n=1 Tax=Mixophyes fleayi TaxID=3061075 RepID=UPI003F4DED3B